MEKFCFASFIRQSPRENIKKDKKFISYNVSGYAMSSEALAKEDMGEGIARPLIIQ